jgi:predicted Zn-dependent protease
MMELTPAEAHHLQAAVGYWELGMSTDALQELSAVTDAQQSHPDILHLRLSILMEQNQWLQALPCAELLCSLLPDQEDPYIKRAFILHEMHQTQAAKDCLLQGPSSLRDNALYYYNMACYECQLNHVQEAWLLLERAIQLDANYREIARTDTDLTPLWPQGDGFTP